LKQREYMIKIYEMTSTITSSGALSKSSLPPLFSRPDFAVDRASPAASPPE
jgi:hypothetical protein